MQNNIEKLVEETINSVDGINRAEVKPFLLTRIYARIRNREDAQNVWSRTGAFLSKPAIALAGLVLIIIINATIILKYAGANTGSNSIPSATAAKDEFAINVISIYDIENQEP